MKGKKHILLLCIFLLTFSVVACVKNPGPTPEPSPSQKQAYVRLDKSQYSMQKYESFGITATLENVAEGVELVWSVSNNNVIELKAEGREAEVEAKIPGEAIITAKAGDAEATCSVTVTYQGDVPRLILDKDIVEVLVGDTLSIAASINYINKTYLDAEFTYTIADPDYASIEGNIITGLKVGKTSLIVVAKWRDIEVSLLTETIEVLVKSDSALTFGAENLVVYTKTIEDYKSEVLIPITAIENGMPISNPEITWEIEDQNIVSILSNSGQYTLKALKVGETRIRAKYIASDGAEQYTDFMDVKTVMPILDKTNDKTVEVDLNGTVMELLQKLGMQSEVLSSIIDVTSLKRNVEVNGDSIVMPKTYYGDKVWEIKSETYGIKVRINAITKIISTESDFNKMLLYAKNEEGQFRGYFVLGSDIDFEGREYNPEEYLSTYNDRDKGFNGIFDGRGYSVKNIKFRKSLFGGAVDPSTSVIVRNIAFQNTDISEIGWAMIGGTGKGIYENIYIEITKGNAAKGILLNEAYGPTVKNVIISLGESVEVKGLVGALYGEVTLSNFYLISPSQETRARFITQLSKSGINEGNIFATAAAFNLAKSDWNELGFNGWLFPDKTEISGLITVKAGASINLNEIINSKYFKIDINSLPNGISYSNGLLSAQANMSDQTATIKAYSSLPGATREYTLTLSVKEMRTLEDIEYNVDEKVDLEILAQIEGEPQKLTIGSIIVNFIYSDGKVIVSYADANVLQSGISKVVLSTPERDYTFNLKIIKGVSIEINNKDITIDSYDLGDGQVTSYQINAELWADGQKIEGVKFVYSSLDNSVAIVSESGLIKAVGAGTAKIKVTAEGYNNVFADINVTVKLAVNDKTVSSPKIEVEMNGLNFTSLANAIGLVSGDNIITIKDITDASNPKDAQIIDGNIVGLSYGDNRVWQINGSKTGIKVQVFAITKIIRTPGDLNNMLKISKIKENVYDGYFVLGGDIDFAGAAYSPTDHGAGWFEGDNLGFTGIFDGKGYTIKNIKIGGRGLFGGLGTTARIKNFGLIAEINSTLEWGLFGGTASDLCEINNIYIKVTNNLLVDKNKGNPLINVGYGVRIENVVIHIAEGVEMSSAFLQDYYGAKERIKQVYLIVENSTTYNNTKTRNMADVLNVYNSITQLVETDIQWDTLGFGEYWSFETEIPIIKAK